MADLSPTAADVLKATGSTVRTGTAGAAIDAGQVLYTASSEMVLAQADTSTKATAVGIALNDAAEDQPITYLVSGGIDVGCTLTVGQVYVVSDNAAGAIAPYGDLASEDYVTILGVATTAANLQVDINVNTVAVPA